MNRWSRVLPLLLLPAAAAAYTVAAWRVAPGFYDGLQGPPPPYNWVSPPPQFVKGNKPAAGGQLAIKVVRGVSDPGSVFTADSQASLSFVPAVFTAPSDGSPISIEITPVGTFPAPGPHQFATNVYLIKSSSPLVKEAIVTLSYTDQLPAPSDVFNAPAQGGDWKDIGSTGTSAPYTVTARTSTLGYFAAGYPPSGGSASGARVGGGSTLPILVAVAIVIVLLAGFPLALLRRGNRTSPVSTSAPRTGSRRPGTGTGRRSPGSRKGR